MAVDGATKYYQTKTGAVHALDDVSLEVREGEFLCILGPSGCGKTTLLWSMAGLHRPERRRDHASAASRSPGRIPQIAMIFQDANLLPWRTLEKNIQLPFELKRKPPDQARINKLLERVGLAGFDNKYPRELSGGMQQRASIVRSLAVDPVGAADGRAVRRARRLHPRRDEPAHPGDLDGDRQDHRLRHPFDPGGDLPRRPRRRDVGAARAGSPRSTTSTFRGRGRSRSRPQPDFIERVLEIKSRIDHQRGAACRPFDDRLGSDRGVERWTRRCQTRFPPSTRSRQATASMAGGLSASLVRAAASAAPSSRSFVIVARRGRHHRRRRVPAHLRSRCRNTSCRRRARS